MPKHLPQKNCCKLKQPSKISRHINNNSNKFKFNNNNNN